MTTAEIQRFRRRLIALKKRVGGDLSALEEEALRPVGGESAGNLSDVPVHPADLGTENFDEELDLALVENQEQLLADINDALARIERGTYGRCESCHRRISKDRLEAVPYTSRCIACAERAEGEA